MKVHSTKVYVSVSGTDISEFVKSHTWSNQVSEHDVTAYGATAHAFEPGLPQSTLQLSGDYDSDTSAGPGVVLRPLSRTPMKVPVVYRPEGTGGGLPEEQFTAFVTAYDESGEAAGYVQWSATLRAAGAITATNQ